jgi:hypothetical protein
MNDSSSCSIQRPVGTLKSMSKLVITYHFSNDQHRHGEEWQPDEKHRGANYVVFRNFLYELKMKSYTSGPIEKYRLDRGFLIPRQLAEHTKQRNVVGTGKQVPRCAGTTVKLSGTILLTGKANNNLTGCRSYMSCSGRGYCRTYRMHACVHAFMCPYVHAHVQASSSSFTQSTWHAPQGHLCCVVVWLQLTLDRFSPGIASPPTCTLKTLTDEH